MRLDLFCKVIDNFGDIGVCWRLAQQLQQEYALQVRLWVDDLVAFKMLCPTLDLAAAVQMQSGVLIQHWHAGVMFEDCADAVIEVFACDIPPAYLRLMAAQEKPPVWLNLEYLSAEDWVDDCHLLPSIHPQLGLKKQFFFPGFTPQTGGLLCETSLLRQRDAYQAQLSPQTALSISLFFYPNPALPALLQAWQQSPQAIDCYVAAGKPLVAVQSALGQVLAPDTPLCLGSLTLHTLPFLSPQAYDELLWRCDFNFVRGEDSFVRAQWAAKPFVWHIYPQDDGAHQAKLAAFLQRYLEGAPESTQTAVKAMHEVWNSQTAHPEAIGPAWQGLLAQHRAIQAHGQDWCQRLAQQNNLAASLVKCLK